MVPRVAAFLAISVGLLGASPAAALSLSAIVSIKAGTAGMGANDAPNL